MWAPPLTWYDTSNTALQLKHKTNLWWLHGNATQLIMLPLPTIERSAHAILFLWVIIFTRDFSRVSHASKELLASDTHFNAVLQLLSFNRSLSCQRVYIWKAFAQANWKTNYYHKHRGKWMKPDNSAGQEHKRLPLPLFLFFQLIASSDALHPYPTGSASINHFDCYRG